ncbi:hypothetical protein O181_115148 [Austropuccinia psidii MF-1]|uniref:MULE transposase domain-containing protein n=1 Tax=Austropuccinia psidii MF-1 TaxID=1389203 RepID=A0A9Q3PV90_9BASI|nr:hypothetical protein [Austropuccinia psidii MF-1]
MVGQTATGHTFSLAFFYMERENDNGYIWALQELKILFQPPRMPKVIITDCDPALKMSIELVFPSSIHNYCTWHISKNLIQNCCNNFQEDDWKDYQTSWNLLPTPIQEKNVTAWASQNPHLGNQASSHVESAHSYRKSFVDNSNGELSTVFQNFKTEIDIQLKHFHHTMGKERVCKLTDVSPPFKQLLGTISIKAIKIIEDKFQKLKQQPNLVSL